MKLTKETLKQIIKEEMEAVMNEAAIYTKTGAYQILDPKNPDDLAMFKKVGIRDPQSSAKKALELRKGTAQANRPGENYDWVFLAYANKNKNAGWNWFDKSNSIDVLPDTFSRGPEAYGQDPKSRAHMDKVMNREYDK
tara:strand:+ start:21 stop:434 length:414 start_codon:yes stop_codon:yes gene_type:complete